MRVVDLEKYYKMVDEMYDNLIEKRFNPNHDARGRFTTGSGGGSGRKYGTTNTADAIAQIKNGTDNSLKDHMDGNGLLSPEREKLHRDIIDDELKGKVPVDGQATLIMLGGGPASGKSSILSTKPEDIDEHTVVINPDEVKERLPNYAELSAKDENASTYFHEESSALAKRLSEVAYSENLDVIYDGTGDGSVNSVMKKINQARDAGYAVQGKYVTVDVENALERNEDRYLKKLAKGEPARKVPEDVVRTTHRDVTDILGVTAPNFDAGSELWDNRGSKGQEKLIATYGGGKGLTPVAGQEQAFFDFLSKGKLGMSGFEKQPDGSYMPTTELVQDLNGRRH